MSFTDTVGGTTVQVDGDLNPRLPLVILLHGNGGTSLDMTDPATGRRGLAFDRTAPPPFPLWRSIGFFAIPPALPVFGFAMDPDITPLTSWKEVFNNAGFSTLSYTQVS